MLIEFSRCDRDFLAGALVVYKYLTVTKTGYQKPLYLLMIDLNHIIDFATQLPHPSDIGLIKPSGGFNIAAALCGLGAVFGAAQFFYYSDDSKRVDPWARPDK